MKDPQSRLLLNFDDRVRIVTTEVVRSYIVRNSVL